MDPAELESNAKAYAALWDLSLNLRTPLGEGTDGKVWKSSAGTAVKAVEREVGYYNERDRYQRLAEYGLTRKIDGFWVPRLVGYHDELRVIEMELVGDPPFIIDFAKVRIDRPPDFSEETMREAEEKCEELFQHHWPEVRMLLATLESYGIYYLDPRPWNIVFTDL